MMKMAAEGEFESGSSPSRPKTSESYYQYAWSPQRSSSHARHRSRSDSAIRLGTGKSTLHSTHRMRASTDALDFLPQDNSLFGLPDHDSVIKASRHLSSMASRQSAASRQSLYSSVGEELGLPAVPGAQSRLSNVSAKQPSHSEPTPIDLPSKKPRKKQTRSTTATSSSGNLKLPPPPVKVTITQEKLRNPSGSKAAKLRYTSHWGEEKWLPVLWIHKVQMSGNVEH